MKRSAYIFFLSLLCAFGCSSDALSPASSDWRLDARIIDVQGLSRTKVSYGGEYGEHSEFEVGDIFGLFVLDASNNVQVNNLQVYCSGFDNKGGSVWSIFKSGSSDDNTSNYPLSEILSRGRYYFAYYPYNESLAVSNLAGLKAMVEKAYDNLPSDQSGAYSEYDLLIASNVPDFSFGEVKLSGKSVSLKFGHATAMLRYFIPSGCVKYEYRFSGADFTPYLMKSADGKDELRYLFKPGCILDVCVKFVKDNKLYKFETGNSKNIWPITTKAGHCYFLDENAPKVPYSTAVDMGTSVMWADFNLGAEDSPDATRESVRTLPGTPVMWAVNCFTPSYGQSEYNKYNNSFTSSTKPVDLPLSYDFSSDVRYDAARNLWGGKWRTPTLSEWQELYNACTTVTDTENHTITFTSKTTKNSIILKFAGYYDSSTQSQPTTGYYWTSTAHDVNLPRANSTLFAGTSSTVMPKFNTNANRYTGLPVRPVYSK